MSDSDLAALAEHMGDLATKEDLRDAVAAVNKRIDDLRDLLLKRGQFSEECLKAALDVIRAALKPATLWPLAVIFGLAVGGAPVVMTLAQRWTGAGVLAPPASAPAPTGVQSPVEATP